MILYSLLILYVSRQFLFDKVPHATATFNPQRSWHRTENEQHIQSVRTVYSYGVWRRYMCIKYRLYFYTVTYYLYVDADYADY